MRQARKYTTLYIISFICLLLIAMMACVENMDMNEANKKTLTMTITGQSYELTEGENEIKHVQLLVYKQGVLEYNIPLEVGKDLVLQDKVPYIGKYLGHIKVTPDRNLRTFYAICNAKDLTLPIVGTPLSDLKAMKWTQIHLPSVQNNGKLSRALPYTGGDEDTIQRVVYNSIVPGEINIPVARAVGRIDSLRFKKENDSFTAKVRSVKLYNSYAKGMLMQMNAFPTIIEGESIVPAITANLQTNTTINTEVEAKTQPFYLYENYTYTKPAGEWVESGLPYLEIKWEINEVEQTPKIIPIQGMIEYEDGVEKTIYGIKRNHVYRAVFTVKNFDIVGKFYTVIEGWEENEFKQEIK